MALNNRILLAVAAGLLVAALSLFAFVLYEYNNSACYDDLHKAGLDQEAAELFKAVGTIVAGLRKGSSDVPKWEQRDFQEAVKDASHLVADGRRALKEKDAFAALKAAAEIKKPLARAKNMATNRVNEILRVQDPADYDAFEKYRLEGKQLVEVVRQINTALEMLSDPSRKLPGRCDW